MKVLNLAFLIFTFCNLTMAQNTKLVKHEKLAIGDQLVIKSKILQEDRVLNIYLPYGYDKESLKTYPVIYLLDGSLDEDFLHIVGLVQFGSFSWINLIPETIVVGIANVDRKRDFTYASKNELDQKEFPNSGQSENFIKFIGNELQPFIESNYKTNPTKTFIGQSLGGLLATEILFYHPELFTNYIVVSPSLWWDGEDLLKGSPKNYGGNKSIYIAVGKEGEVMERTAKELYTKLKKNGNQNTGLYFEFLEDKTHGDALHMATYHAFESIFQKTP